MNICDTFVKQGAKAAAFAARPQGKGFSLFVR